MAKTKKKRAVAVESESFMRELPAVANYIRRGRCALFVGAGLSVPAGYPLWPALIDRLIARTIKELGTVDRPTRSWTFERSIVDARDAPALRERYEKERALIADTARQLRRLAKAQRLLEVADQCRSLVGPGRFAPILRALFPTNAKPTAVHRTIVDTPYACVLTTNFDSLLEDAYAMWGSHGRPKAPTGIELADHGTLLLDRTFFVLKAHGTIEDSASLVFTSDDYRRISFATPAFQAVMSAIFLNYAVLFVGYSLGDPNFRLLFDSQLTTFGAEVPPRYAIMGGVGGIERELLWRTARIRTIAYPEGKHELVPKMLAYLAKEVATSPPVIADGRSVSRGQIDASGPIAPPRRGPALYVRIALRGIRLDATWTDTASYATAWRDFDAGAETTVGAAMLLPEELAQQTLPYSAAAMTANRKELVAIGAMLARAMPDGLLRELAALRDGCPIMLSLTAESEPLPWEWLLVDGTPLAERNPVVRVPVCVSDSSRGRAYVTRPIRALVIGDPGSGHASPDSVPEEFRNDVWPLKGAREESMQVAKLIQSIPGARARLLMGAEATYATVMREVRTGDYDVIHFAGHAWFDERESYLALHDGRVWVSELSSLLQERPPALMMMNSHYTAFVPLFAPHLVPGIAPPRTMLDHLEMAVSRVRGFTRLANRVGVAEFVACLGEPGDDSGSRFATDMYEALALRGATVANAMLHARRRNMDPHDVTALLYTHSGYGDTVLRERPVSR